MSSKPVDHTVIDRAFEDNAPLRKRVYSAIASTPEHARLFEDIAKYTSTLRSSASSGNSVAGSEAGGPAAKKRKLINGGAAATGQMGGDAALLAGLTADAELQFYVQDLSFAIPQRKKLRLELTRLPAAASASASAGGLAEYLRARNQGSGEVEFGVPLEKIQHILCLPVPEKTQRQFNFCIIPEYGDGITSAPDGQVSFEPIVWTIPDGPPRTAFLGSGTPAMESANLAETYESYLRRTLDGRLKQTKVVCPSEKEFVSPTPEAHRKGDKAYHVKAFRGSKEGFLFFLSTGIFFGFKKPLIFFSLENIDSISYTSVLQRTFNLNIAARSPLKPDEVQEFELSMIDQSNHPGIDAYIKKHGLQDASLAEARRAKKLNINGVKGDPAASGDDDGAVSGGDGEESELVKAQRELEDQEDEEEEDYDPGSEGDSDGSGSSSEEEEEEVGGGDAGDLVKEELGSEAEEVEED
ncbi:histone chaperone [Helicocarpus griseus UAMH5409]|uniref:Histone chaperone n=1 Tax=Helicocarpus griseus UAMH5409 TaxID=1447875 RepID=A0A2B7X4U8_9EURO|nr:histone chaperone [Helicocarpus griseus UAMH5409]